MSPFRAFLILLYAATLGAFLYFLAYGRSYYLTPLLERPHHELYWILKPGGSLGRSFGIAGALMMTVMHVYSARKRLGFLRGLGALRNWLDFHILLGIAGPLFVVLHSSFKVQGLVAISFWSMVAVAVSGVFGRYLYLQIPRTRAGEALTLAEVEKADHALATRLRSEFSLDEAQMKRLEELSAPPREGRGLWRLLVSILAQDLNPLSGRRLRAFLREAPGVPPALSREFATVAGQKAALRRRLLLWDGLHRLFHYWHVVHKPFAIVMYVFMLVHIGVASVTGYGWTLPE